MIILNPTADLTGLAEAGQGKHVAAPDDGTFAPTSPVWEPDVFNYHLCCGWYERFIGSSTEWSNGSSGSGSGVFSGPNDEINPGALLCATGTTNTGRGSRTLALGQTTIVFDASSGLFRFEAKMRGLHAVSDGTDTYVFRSGFMDAVAGAPVDGIFVEVDSNVDPQIQFATRSNSTETRVDTGITFVSGILYRFVILVTNDAQADFYLSEDPAIPVLVASITTNIPTGASRATAMGSSILKTAGTNDRRVEVPYMLWDLDRVGL